MRWVREGNLEAARRIRRVTVVTTVVVQTEAGSGLLQVAEGTFKELALVHVTPSILQRSSEAKRQNVKTPIQSHCKRLRRSRDGGTPSVAQITRQEKQVRIRRKKSSRRTMNNTVECGGNRTGREL